jgi:hypothetical protein
MDELYQNECQPFEAERERKRFRKDSKRVEAKRKWGKNGRHFISGGGGGGNSNL